MLSRYVNLSSKIAHMKTKSTIVTELLQTYNEAMDTFIPSKGDIGRIKSLRPSQLPFCPVGFFVYHASHGATRSMDMRGHFYTAIGTAVHTVLQTFLGRSGRFLANWRCPICRKTRKVSMQHECCDFPSLYDEVEISYKGVVGHIDGIFRDKHGHYHILDFKTTSVLSALRKRTDPGISYIEQVEAYALMLWLEHGIKVKSIILMFVKRDNPKEPVIWSYELGELDFKRIKTKIIKYKRQHREALAASTLKEALLLAQYGRCKNPYCKSCKSAVTQKRQIKDAFARGVAAQRLPLKNLS